MLYRVETCFSSPRGEVLVLSYANLDSVPSQSPGVTEVLAEDWNTYVRDNFDTLKRGHVRVANEAGLSSLTVAIGTMVFAEAEESLWVFGTSGWVEVLNVTNPGGASDALTTLVVAAAPTGVINQYAGAAAPAGWLICNGDTVPNGSGTVQGQTRNFAALFALLGSTYGASGKLPDLRGRTAIGAGTGAGLSARSLAATVGAETHTLITAELAAHSHTMAHTHGMKNHTHGGTTGGESGHTHTFNAQTYSGASGSVSNVLRQGGSYSTAGAVATHTHAFSTGGPSDNTTDGSSAANTGNAGSGSAHNNMQPSLVLNYIIKV